MPVPIDGGRVQVCTVPTEEKESDGTLEWDSTTLVLVRLTAGRHEGIGYTYGDRALGPLLTHRFLPLVRGWNALAPSALTRKAVHEARNVGSEGAVMMAISALDVAAHDLKAKLLGVPLADLLGRHRDRVPAYWSAGFTSYTPEELRAEFRTAHRDGFRRFKMKVGRVPSEDPQRVAAARGAIGRVSELYVDANGAYSIGQALDLAERFHESGVTWFEEPVPASQFALLARVRQCLPPGMELATGEYGWDALYFRRVLEAGATDVLQADATRCGGVTGWLDASAIARSFGLPLSSHTAPALHAQLAAATAEPFRHLEFFKDHARLESMLFTGAPTPRAGSVVPPAERPGLGLVPREKEIARFEV
jgi:L-alanine-DL-glutamate epimerase-like enolase superfamily enzyme